MVKTKPKQRTAAIGARRTSSSSAESSSTRKSAQKTKIESNLQKDGPVSHQQTVIERKKRMYMEELARVEASIYELEQTYLAESFGGNAVRGWRADARGRPSVGENDSEMLFSRSSMTSPLYVSNDSKKAKITS